MAGLSDYYENTVIDHLFRAQAFTPPATIYVGLFTAAPTDAGGGTEVSGGGYARSWRPSMRVNHEAHLRVTVINASGVVVDPARIEMWWQVGTAPEQPLTPVRITTGVYEATVTPTSTGQVTWRVATTNPNIATSRTEWVLP